MSLNLMRPEIVALRQYQTETSDASLKLNKNENPWPGVAHDELSLNRYPGKEQQVLIELIADYYQVPADNLLLTRGSDEAIDLIVRLFCRPYQDSVLIMPPTFAMYENYARVNGVKVISVPLIKNGEIDINNLTEQAAAAKVIFICSPNNPSGTVVEVDQIGRCASLCANSIIVVDEAYIDFSTTTSALDLLAKFSNIIVLRTLSKGFGLAGIRCGILCAASAIQKQIIKIAAPYLMNSLSVLAAKKSFTPERLQAIKSSIVKITVERERLRNALLAMPDLFSYIWPSEANFILVATRHAQALFCYCQSKDILLRAYINNPYLSDSLRISIGRPEDNDLLIAVFKSFSREQSK